MNSSECEEQEGRHQTPFWGQQRLFWAEIISSHPLENIKGSDVVSWEKITKFFKATNALKLRRKKGLFDVVE